MLLAIDLTSDVPIYQQLRDRIVEAIAEGSLPSGSRLPATRQLAADFGINFHTVNKAYDLLRQEGLLRLTRKAGATVARDAASGPPPPEFSPGWEERARTLLAEAVAQGMPRGEILAYCEALLTEFGTGASDPLSSEG